MSAAVEGRNRAMAIAGADVDAIRADAARIVSAADQMHQLLGRVDRLIADSPWHGRDATAFAAQWAHGARHVAAARRLLETLSNQLRGHAAAQEAASGLASSAGRAEGLLRSLHAGEITDADLRTSAARLLSSLSDHTASIDDGLSVGYRWEGATTVGAPWGPVDIGATGFVGAAATVNGFGGFQDGQLRAGIDFDSMVGAKGSFDLSTDLGFVPVGVHAEALAGAEASANVHGALGPDGFSGGASGSAFAGVSTGARVEASGDYGSAGADAGVSFGAGIGGGASGVFGIDKVGFSGDFEIAIGPGFKFDYDLSVNPRSIGNDFMSFGAESFDTFDATSGALVSGATCVLKSVPIVGGLF